MVYPPQPCGLGGGGLGFYNAKKPKNLSSWAFSFFCSFIIFCVFLCVFVFLVCLNHFQYQSITLPSATFSPNQIHRPRVFRKYSLDNFTTFSFKIQFLVAIEATG
jgi:hypothetical protein